MATTHNHPTPRQYVQIALGLAAITGIEVALFYLNESVDLHGWNAPLLIILSFLKFIIVIGWYMHLRFEKPMLNKLFSIGFGLAIGVYAVVLATFGMIAL